MAFIVEIPQKKKDYIAFIANLLCLISFEYAREIQNQSPYSNH